jgi:hypothetical protein
VVPCGCIAIVVGRFDRQCLGLDGTSSTEVLLGDHGVSDAGVDESHPRRPVGQQRSDGLERHAAVEALGGEGVAELVRMHVADTGATGDGLDVAMDGAPVEGLVVVSFDEQTGAGGSPPGPVVVGQAADVDLDEGTVRVRRSASEVDGQVVIGPPKSAAGRRTVAIPASIVPAVQAHLAAYAEAGARGRVFVGEKGATMRRGNFQQMSAKALKAAGPPRGFHFHDLRHTRNA